MPWYYRSTLEAKRLTREAKFLDLRSHIGLRPDGTEFLKLFGKDMEAQHDRVMLRDHGICQICFEKCALGEVDHIRSRGRGGDDSMQNLRWTCGAGSTNKCHAKRHVRVRFGEAVKV